VETFLREVNAAAATSSEKKGDRLGEASTNLPVASAHVPAKASGMSRQVPAGASGMSRQDALSTAMRLRVSRVLQG